MALTKVTYSMIDGAVVNVADFGALPSESPANNSVAIQAAIDYAKANGVRVVEVPSGVYQISTPIKIEGSFGYAGIEFRGNNSTIRQTTDDVLLYVDPTTSGPAPEFRMNAVIHGFYFIGPGKASLNSVGVQCQNGAGITISDCIIRNFYKGLYGHGCLISNFEILSISACSYGIYFESTATYAPNDNHFNAVKIFGCDKGIKCINFPNGAMTFIGCEIEGNNLSGNTTDGVKVSEFFNAGKVTFIGCHFELNPGQYNLYFDSSAGKLSIIGCEMIPGDSCGIVLYVDGVVSGASDLFLEGSRIVNNIGTGQTTVVSPSRGVVMGDTGGYVSGSLVTRIVGNTIYSVSGSLNFSIGGPGSTNRIILNRTGSYEFEPGTNGQQDLGSDPLRWKNLYANTIYTGTGSAKWTSGTGSPEGVLTAPVGSLFTRTDGGANTTLYVKESGTGDTGWVAK